MQFPINYKDLHLSLGRNIFAIFGEMKRERERERVKDFNPGGKMFAIRHSTSERSP
jgi:hypothetical protein